MEAFLISLLCLLEDEFSSLILLKFLGIVFDHIQSSQEASKK